MSATTLWRAALALAAVVAASASLQPDDPAPSFSLNLLDNQVYSYSPSNASALPIILWAYDGKDAVNQAMITSNDSIDEFLTMDSDRRTTYLIASHASTATAAANDTTMIRDRVYERLGALNLTAAAVAAWKARLHFAVDPVASVTPWIPSLLSNWTRPSTVLQLTTAGAAPVVVPRLDSFYAWLSWPSFANLTVVPSGDGCSNITGNLNGNAAFLVQSLNADGTPKCSFTDMILHAEQANASTAIIAAAPGLPLQTMNCFTDADCSKAISISATMVPSSVASLITTGSAFNATCVTDYVPGFFMAINTLQQLQEVGWVKYWSLKSLAWESQWLDGYVRDLYTNITSRQGDLVVKVMDNLEMHGKAGAVATVKLPPGARSNYASLTLDMALGCPGPRDTNCSIWDHTINLYVDCCPVNTTGPLCGQELGRWITPFRRRVGRWLTDVSSLLPLLTSDTCTFTMRTPPWAGPWYPTLNLWFGDKTPSPAAAPRPKQVVNLFQGKSFDDQYNNRTSVSFLTPAGATKAELYAVITGHGSDAEGCAEFCVTSHSFQFNTNPNNTRTFSSAGTPWGCSERILDGSIPNQHGTWVYGRDGWCDAMDVKPWVVDVTSQLQPAGSSTPNTAVYWGLFNGVTPKVAPNSGAYIILYSHVVFYF